MKKIVIISIILASASVRVAFAKVVFLPGNTVQGNSSNSHGVVVCVEHGQGRVTGCAPFDPIAQPGHDTTDEVAQGQSWNVDDNGGWFYHSDPADPAFGQVQVNCAHPDRQGVAWLMH